MRWRTLCLSNSPGTCPTIPEKHWESTALDVKPEEQAYWSAIAAKDFSRKPLRSPELKMI
jgi:hypothetical protein